MKRMIMDDSMGNNIPVPSADESEKPNTARESLYRENQLEDNLGANSFEDRYAHMFADWDLLPPQVLVRRVSRK